MAVKPTITAYGGGVEQFPIFLNRAFTDYSYERAERDFAKFISQTAKTSPTGSFNLQGANGQIIPEVVNARKMPNVNALGQDNLTDLSLVLRNGRTLRVNTKGSFAPIITHNNIFSVFAAAPAMTKKFISTVITKYKGMGFRDNQLISRNVPPIYAELRGEHNRKMVVGTPQVGGPIDFFFEGQPVGQYDEEQNVVSMQASILDAYGLSKTKSYYLVCQPPPMGARFSFVKTDIRGMPIIHTGGRSINLVDRSFVPAGSTVLRI
jgi:hypothetical protein|tara:strand:- start:304 stop:1095 length:792 start_codon:yes stop_codon:yes gene_type:complete